MGGFNFDNVHRNSMIEKMFASSGAMSTVPGAMSTGTTISGMVFDGGVVLGADTRATNGEEVAEKNCEKIHYLAPTMFCCGAGTAADTEKTTELISSQLALLRMETHSPSRVITACTMLRRLLFRYQGQIGAALVLGGTDVDGPHIYQIYPHGSTGKLPYTTMGSGSLAAMAVYESSWREGMPENEAVELVQRTVLAGIFNDLGSGSNVDICVMRTDGTVDMRRNVLKPNQVQPIRDSIQRSARLTMPLGVTPVLATTYTPHPTVAGEETTATEMEVEA